MWESCLPLLGSVQGVPEKVSGDTTSNGVLGVLGVRGDGWVGVEAGTAYLVPQGCNLGVDPVRLGQHVPIQTYQEALHDFDPARQRGFSHIAWSRLLHELGFHGQWGAVVDGRLPHAGRRGRWLVSLMRFAGILLDGRGLVSRIHRDALKPAG